MAKYYTDFAKRDEYHKGEIYYIYPAKTLISDNVGRPAVIISNDIRNEHSDDVLVVYLTTKKKNPLPTHVEIVCKTQATALCETICTVSKERIGDFVKVCSDAELRNIELALCEALGIEFEGREVEDNYEEILELTKERDIYKKMYEELLQRVIG